jgi:ethanolamine permease
LITGAVLGFATALAIQYLPHDSPVAGVLLNMAVFGAVIAYVFQMLSFLLLRWRHASIERPFVSPLGVVGAVTAIVISIVTLLALFLNPDYQRGAWGALIWFLCGLLYFAFYARKGLIRSPEEEFALRRETARGTGSEPS